MNRILLPAIALVLLGAGLWFGLTSRSDRAPSEIAALLPKETLALLHLPDLDRSREQWRATDIYRLWREPAVQEFLERPLTRNPGTLAGARQIEQLEPLEIKNAFVALIPAGTRSAKVLAGFQHKKQPRDVEAVIGPWRVRMQEQVPQAKRETVQHGRHRLEVLSDGGFTFATVHADDWFFAANEVLALQTVLDRADGRKTDAATTLLAEEDYTNAVSRMPGDYAVLGYARVEQLFARWGGALPQDTTTTEQPSLLRQVRSVAAASRFDGGTIRDTLFVAMPPLGDLGQLTRDSLSLATADTFLYIASQLHLPQEMELPSGSAVATPILSAALQRLLVTLAESGITREQWNAAFGTELGVIGGWPSEARFPALLATVPVRDPALAQRIVSGIANSKDEDRVWSTTEDNGVRYYTQPPLNPMVPLAPTIAISDQLVVAGLDAPAVRAAMARAAAGAPGLATVAPFQTAEALVPQGKNSFTYVDLGLLYTRLDAALRPMLIMAAAFVPGITESVDLGKLPPPEVVVRHLSPIAVSQSYDGNGYLTTSAGPVSIYQAALGVAFATGAGARFYQEAQSAIVTDPAASPAPPASQIAPDATPPEPELEEDTAADDTVSEVTPAPEPEPQP